MVTRYASFFVASMVTSAFWTPCASGLDTDFALLRKPERRTADAASLDAAGEVATQDELVDATASASGGEAKLRIRSGGLRETQPSNDDSVSVRKSARADHPRKAVRRGLASATAEHQPSNPGLQGLHNRENSTSSRLMSPAPSALGKNGKASTAKSAQGEQQQSLDGTLLKLMAVEPQSSDLDPTRTSSTQGSSFHDRKNYASSRRPIVATSHLSRAEVETRGQHALRTTTRKRSSGLQTGFLGDDEDADEDATNTTNSTNGTKTTETTSTTAAAVEEEGTDLWFYAECLLGVVAVGIIILYVMELMDAEKDRKKRVAMGGEGGDHESVDSRFM
ncbi:unnamed protein product [Amoebophrya sp. A120]|nr:unnamed protein product [Amoebophrya sp. A120]|eukprot:GSA120T00003473001.1